ncbi:hypothetical protein FXV83_08300 [Bradyrhizobium hipponense]|uniref:Uncharacterized protein n=1 Tax=Bradyrhizobium hipponense TaxID=2605638 RepID=A0A5S4YS15_9BRAD|nr:hypothetical protein [Bradyrhizobium hipponense]TYO67180.1 hypothetical protein FXV83_08300 [Bradyrhizobium hipponense]
MSDAENAFAEATDQLIGLYRGVERRTLDLPLVSIMPMLILLWAVLKFYFFFVVGVFLIIPVNLVIAIRNCFPGHWRYRQFFLRQLHYIWIWLWRGEAPSAPLIFVRPLLIIFMKGHFHGRLRRLRQEILLGDGISDTARSALLGRLDAAIERWKSPQLTTVFTTILLPAIASFPSWYKQLTEFSALFAVRLPPSLVANFTADQISPFALHSLYSFGLSFLIAIPMTALLAKRGLFLGADPGRICFPGGQEGQGVYAKESAILSSVGVRGHEAPADLWLFAVSFVLSMPIAFLSINDLKTRYPEAVADTLAGLQLRILIIQGVVFLALLSLAFIRRGRTGRS